MTYRQHANRLHESDRRNDYIDRNRNGYDRQVVGHTHSANNYREPYVFLDLRNYFASAEPKYANRSVDDRYNYQKEPPHSRSSDYIRPPSASHSRRSKSAYIPPSPKYERRYTSYSPETYDNNATTTSDRSNYVSPWDKSDSQMIKEGGWRNQRNFMESHGLSIYEPGDFDEAKDLLDGYRRVDAEAAGEYKTESEYDYDRTARYSKRRENDDVYQDENQNDSISSYETREYDTSGQNFSPESRDSGQAYVPYRASSVAGYGEERKHFQESDDSDQSSDCDSTDAIGYYSDSDVNNDDDDDLGGDDCVDDESTDEYDDDEYC